MKNRIKRAIKKLLLNKGFYLLPIPKAHKELWQAHTYDDYAAAQHSINTVIGQLLYDLGYLKSLQAKRSVDAHDQVMPWMTYPFIRFIETVDLKDKVIFEYGAGNGTLYWAKRAQHVYSVEHDEQWFEELKSKAPSNVSLYLASEIAEYVGAIKLPKTFFDVIIVDGLRGTRAKAMMQAITSLKPGGMIILDNANRYLNIHEYMLSNNFVRFSFEGFTPAVTHGNSTCVYIHVPNFLFRQSAHLATLASDGDLQFKDISDLSDDQMLELNLKPVATPKS